MENKVVARFVDGRTVKGTTKDFFPGKDVFHVEEAAGLAGTHPTQIQTRQLKALFFVKDLAGDPQRAKTDGPGPLLPAHPARGRPVRVLFTDGEVMVGTTNGYQPGRQGFFLEPADDSSNEERCYILAGATQEITFP